MRRLLYIVLLFLTLPMAAQEELCIDGTLLFREDFGGNDQNDPRVSATPVPGMTYKQVFAPERGAPGGNMEGGCYLVTKEGYRNSDLKDYSCWHIMDDHTYPNDKTRGYLMEVDALGSGNNEFFCTTIDGLCAGNRLTFSAYVVNLTTAGQYLAWINRNYVHPKLSFIITDPNTNTELARYNTDTIGHDWGPSAIDGSVRKKWQESADWQLVGMNFTVPEGVYSVRLAICNNALGSSTGNDFAMDDIEIHLCIPKPEINGESEVCEDGEMTLTAEVTNDGTMAEPLKYKWWHSTDSITWTEMPGFHGENLVINPVQKVNSGWYKAAVSGDGNIESVNCRAMSEPFRLRVSECAEELCIDGTLLFREDFGGNNPDDPRVGTNPVPGMSYTQATTDVLGSMGGGKYLVTKQGYCNGNGTSQWHLQDDHTYFGDLTRGYLLEIDGFGDNSAFYTTTIDGLCEGSHLTFSAYVANVMTWGMYIGHPGTYAYPRLKFVLADPATDAELAMYDTGDIPFDSSFIGDNMCWKQSVEWRLVGMNFTVPAGQNSIKLTIYNNATGSNGNDFAIDDIEIRLCAPPVTIAGEGEVCTNTSTTLTANFSNDGTFAEPLAYKWWHSTDSITWTEMSGFNGEILAINTVQKADSGWYKVAVSGDGNIDNTNCRVMSEPFLLRVNECEPPEPPVEELCMDGILLFREDFGGNDPDDPRVRTTPVSGMSYAQVTNDVFHSMGSGKYIVTKSGYCNGDTTGWSLPGADQSTYRSQWYIQDDHTYPNDYSRGYFMEIDGSGGNQQFYQTEISGLCEGIELTFSAYVANVFTWFQYDWYTRNRGPVIAPCLKFVLTNPQTGETLAEKNTQEIPFAEELAAKTDWQYSSPWYLVGMNFIVPSGVPAIRLTIYNNVTNGNGNDFALDDIDIRLCMTPDTVRTDTTVCDTLSRITWHGKEFAITDTLRDTLLSSCGFDSIYYELHVTTTPCEEALCMDGILLFREDFGGNRPSDPMVSRTPMPGISSIYQQDYNYSAGYLAGMHYIIAKQGHPNSDFHAWHIMDDHTYPNDITQGYFFETNSRANSYYTNYIYQKEVAGLCAGMQLSFSAYFANVVTAREFKTVPFLSYSYPKFVFVVTDARTGEQLARYNTDTIGHDWSLYNIPDSWQYSAQWHLKGMKFTVPEGVDKVTLSIIDDPTQYGNAEGDDYAVDDIELHLCSNVEYQTVDTTICDTLLPFSWRGIEWIKADTIGKIYKDAQGNDSLYLVYSLRTIHCPYPPVSVSQDTTICDTLSQIKWHDKLFPITPEIHDTAYDAYGYDSVYYTLRVTRYHCPYPPVTISSDTTICDTLAQIAWRDKIYAVTSELRDTLYEAYGADSVYFILHISTHSCCPDIVTLSFDTLVCDTLLPFTWTIGGQPFIFLQSETQYLDIPHPRWINCIDTSYIIHLDTFHCDRLYLLIVNKYNWQLLCDNVALRNFFPERTATAFQWYKNEQPISGATEDDYAEQNELCGVFQLNVQLDDGRSIWSNIIEIKAKEEIPIRVQIYNSQGMPVSEEQLSQGVYLYRYERGDEVWIEKKWIP